MVGRKKDNTIREIMDKVYRKKPWNRGVTAIAAVIVFITTYLLILPAITMTKDIVCGKEEHIHNDQCYETTYQRVLNCPYTQVGDGVIILHKHDENCYDTEGKLICPLQETEEHVHTAACFGVEEQDLFGSTAVEDGFGAGTPFAPAEEGFGAFEGTDLFSSSAAAAPLCGKAELVPHTHTEECYDFYGNLICGKPEVIAHQHGEECFSFVPDKRVLICGKEEHVHDDSCYASKNEEMPEEVGAVEDLFTGEAAEENAVIDGIGAADDFAAAPEEMFGSEIEEENIAAISEENDNDNNNNSDNNEDSHSLAFFIGAGGEEAFEQAAAGENLFSSGESDDQEPGFDSGSEGDAALPAEIEGETVAESPDKTEDGNEFEESFGESATAEETTEFTVVETTTEITTEAFVLVLDEDREALAEKESESETAPVEDAEQGEGDDAGEEIAEAGEVETTVELITEVTSEMATDYTISEQTTELHTEDTSAEQSAEETTGEPLTEYVAEITTEEVSAEQSAQVTTEATMVEQSTEITTEWVAGESMTEQTTEWTAIESMTEQTTEGMAEWTTSETLTEQTTEGVTEWKTSEEQLTEQATEGTTEWTTFEPASELTTERATEWTTFEPSTEITTEWTTVETSTEQTTDWVETTEYVEPTTAVLEYIGKDYKVRVTYLSASGIPAGAKVEAEEIAYDSDEYAEYLAQAKSALGLDESKELPKEYARFFDIQIMAVSEDGEWKEIEPTGPVRVEIIYDQPVNVEGADTAEANIVHFDQQEEETRVEVLATIDATPNGENGEETNHTADTGLSEAENGEEEGTTGGEENEEAEDTESLFSSEENVNGNSPTPEVTDETEAEGISSEVEADENAKGIVSFETGSFSVYGVIYTVDFHYEVNGKVYEFSIPGGGFVSLEHVVEVLGISELGTNNENSSASTENGEDSQNETEANLGLEVPGNDDSATYEDSTESLAGSLSSDGGENTSSYIYQEAINLNNVEVSEATKRFVANVVSVEFSNPELVWVGKINVETTVGALKVANELEVQYSVELTEEQIAKINEQTVESGDWALISMLPFTSEESLTVTMKNGDQFVIKVTDAQNVTSINEDDFDGVTKFVIWAVGSDGKNYALKSNGDTEEINPDNIDSIGSEFQWTIKEGYWEGQTDTRYIIRPVDDASKSLTLNQGYHGPSEIVTQGDNAIYLYPPYTEHCWQSNTDYIVSDNTGWLLEGWGYTRLNLGWESLQFEGHHTYCSNINLTKIEGAPIDVIDTSENKVDNRLHYIITDHYTNSDKPVVRANGYLEENDNSLTLSYRPIASQEYAGVTVTTGHDAVIINNNGDTTISYDPDVHLVHIDYYYKNELTDVQVTQFDENNKYDTKIVNGKKYYELSEERIHTEKTASVVEGGDGRSFYLTLEAWNVDWNIATVGMVLDASGSMAWDGAPGHTMQVNEDGKYEPYKFLSQSEVNKILCTDYSDYSPAGYGNYTYFVYENGKSVNEYAPLGYWNGSTRVTYNNQTYLTLDGDISTAYAISTAGVQANRPGWYYVNTGNATPYNAIGGAKDYNGISNKDQTFNIETSNGTKTISFYNSGGYNDSIKEWFVDGDTTGKYRTSSAPGSSYGSSQSTPAQFYVDDEGLLHCFYLHSDTIFESYVYKKTDDESIKTEMLQDAIGSFTSTLHGIAPDSAIGMTRFSRSNYDGTDTPKENKGFNDAQLPLLNWTTNSTSIIGALNLAYGTGNLANGNTTDNGYSNANSPLNVYNYGLTGNTSTQSGLTSFNTYMTNNAALTKWAEDNAKPVVTPSGTIYEYDKYVIVFTDGKDTDQTQNNGYYKDYAETAANQLKANGYNVITVLLAPDSALLKDENGNIKDENGNLIGLNTEFTEAKSFLDKLNGPRNGGTGLDWTDTTYIATAADKTALKQIFTDIAHKISKTLTGMTVRDYIDPRFQLVDEYDRPISVGEHPELGFTLYYDSDRDMQYIEWTGQNIPTNNVIDNAPVGENGEIVDVSLWSKTIRVRAKDDFLGGNEVLSNGNVEELNKVYPDGHPESTDNKVSRTFPRTTVDPQVLNLELGTTEDTLYLGETVDADLHESLESAIGDTVNSFWYYEYLDRYGNATNTDYITQLQQGEKIEIPYYYFPDDTTKATFDAAVLNPNNPDAYMKDEIGTLTYEWVPCDAEGNEITMTNPYNHLTTNTDDIHYRLKIKYTPYSVYARDSFVEGMTDTDTHGRDVKDPVGTEQVEKESEKDEGIATIHVVSGKFQLQKSIKTKDIQEYFINNPDKVEVSFNFTLERLYNSKTETYPDLTTDYKEGYTSSEDGTYKCPTSLMITIDKETVTDLNPDDKEYVTVSLENEILKLPIGTYTLTEDEDDEFKLVSFADVTSTVFNDASIYAAKIVPGTSNILLYGIVQDGFPATATVKEGSPYLNAQEGAVKAENKTNPRVMLYKADMTNFSRPVNNAIFDFYKEVEEDTAEALTEVITNKYVIKISTITSGSYIQTSGDASGDILPGYVELGIADTDNIYYLVESGSPAGYISPDWAYVKMSFENDMVKWTAYNEDGSVYSTPESGDKETIDGKIYYKVTVLNNPGAALPATGGPGTTLFYLIGFLLTTLAGVGVVMKRRKAA